MWGAHVSGETVSYGANLTSAVHHSFESRWAHRAHAAGGIPSTQRLSPEPVDRLVNELRVGRIAAAGRVTETGPAGKIPSPEHGESTAPPVVDFARRHSTRQ